MQAPENAIVKHGQAMNHDALLSALIAASRACNAMALDERIKANEEYTKQEKIAAFALRGITVKESCYRCGGRGRIESFNHVAGGECFRCNGKGMI